MGGKVVAGRLRKAVRCLGGSQVERAVGVLGEAEGTGRFGAGKALIVTCERYPERVYPYFEAIAGLLGGECKIVRWNVMRILALLAGVDEERKLDGYLERYLGFIGGGNMISAANAIGGAGIIGAARPELVERLLPAVLAVEGATYETAECRNVAIGHALDALASWWPAVGGRGEVRGFVERQQGNPRAAVARRARALMAKGN